MHASQNGNATAGAGSGESQTEWQSEHRQHSSPAGALQARRKFWLGPDYEADAPPSFKPTTTVASLPAVGKYLDRIGAKATGVLRAKVEEIGERGYYRTVAAVTFSRVGDCAVKPGYGASPAATKELEPTGEERAAMRAEIVANADKLPSPTTVTAVPNQLFPIDDQHLWVARNPQGGIICAQIRIDWPGFDNVEPKKEYRTFTPLSNGDWGECEPGDKLPLFGLETLKAGPGRIMIHEGAKAAQAARLAAKDSNHPLFDELSLYSHLGWIGGALNPDETDWAALKGYGDLTIVPDNDEPGYAAVARISRLLPRDANVLAVRWPRSLFNLGFDLADAIPDKAIKQRFSIQESLQSATWATRRTNWDAEPKAKPIYAARKAFVAQWHYVATEDRFILARNPNVRYSPEEFSAKLRPFCDPGVRNLAALALDAMPRTFHATTYRPGEPNGATGTEGDEERVNIYTGPRIGTKEGDVGPWLEFLAHLFPVEDERLHAQDWLATLIAKPQQRAGHGLLLINPTEGAAGKGTLVWLLTPLLGAHNVANPSADTIVDSQFNDWIAYKTLVSCAEVYQGHSWRAANKMKALVTDEICHVNIKHVSASDVPNFAWFILASNNPQALRIDQRDRRWYVPEVGDNLWPREKWATLREWAVSGDGFAHILYWAQRYEKLTGREYLKPGMKTPMTEKKQAMIDGSEDESIQTAIEILDAFAATRLQRTDPAKWATLPDEDHPVERRKALQAADRFTIEREKLKKLADGIPPRDDRLSDQHFIEKLAAYGVTKFDKRVVLGTGAKVTLLCWGAPPATADKAKTTSVELNEYWTAVKTKDEKAAKEEERKASEGVSKKEAAGIR
jgi:hypothetical protein